MAAIAGGRTRELFHRIRRRVRLRTRLHRMRQTWRRATARRLRAWSERPPVIATPEPGRMELTVDSPGALPRYAAGVDPGTTARSLRLVVTDWRTPYPGWAGQLGPLPGLVGHEVRLPPRGRGQATVVVDLREPQPLPRILFAAWPALAPASRLAGGPEALARVAVADPRGRDRHGPGLPGGRLRLAHRGDAGWEVVGADGSTTLVAGRVGEPLDDRQRAVLSGLGTVAVPADPDGPPAALAQTVTQLAMTGVVLHGPASGRLLGPELAGLIREPLPGRDADPLAWEARSVRQRRTAMRHHAGWSGPAHGSSPPPVSALLVTKRPHLVGPAVAAMAAQTYPELEIVVGVHGGELPAAQRDRLSGPVVTIPAERNLGEALAEATRAASGTLVTKVDDDDRYGPEHVWDVVLAWLYSGATVAGKGAEFVYLEPKDRTVRRRMGAELFTDSVAGGTVTLARDDLAAAGGWPPVPRWVDRALLDRVLAGGGLVYRAHSLGFIYVRHGDGHTWDTDWDYFLYDARQTWVGLPTLPELG